MREKIRQLKKDLVKTIDGLEDEQIYGVAEILNIALENVEEALNEYDEYVRDQE